jgi:putative transposase
MAHTYVSNLVHCVFSTKERQRVIPPELQQQLYPYLGGIARQNKMKALSVGGMEDHIHLLLSLPATLAIAKAIQLLKGSSSKWMNDNFFKRREFTWQKGYGAFTISVSHRKDTINYIQNQKKHHATRDFKQEFLAFLKRHGIDFDEQYIWD